MYDPEDELEIEWIPEEDDFVPPPRDDLTELDAKIDQSSATIEKNKNESVLQIQNQINEITKLTLSKVAAFDVSDDEIKNAVKSSERSIN